MWSRISAAIVVVAATSALTLAQQGLPLPEGLELSGSWAARNFSDAIGNMPGGGPRPVDYMGIPLNDTGRAWSLIYSQSQISMPERICDYYAPTYIAIGPMGLRIWPESELLTGSTTAWIIGGWADFVPITIWMDGRPHPSKYAPHTWAGFTTGQWQGSTLVTRTTHIKWGWLRRNGVATSDQAEVISYYTRNENVLTVTWIVYDPLYLTEPFVRSADFIAAPRGVTAAAFGVEPADRGNNIFAQCLAREEIARPDLHYVPHYLEGANPFVGEHAKKLGVPVEATLGGAETALPEYKDRLKR